MLACFDTIAVVALCKHLHRRVLGRVFVGSDCLGCGDGEGGASGAGGREGEKERGGMKKEGTEINGRKARGMERTEQQENEDEVNK